MVEVRIQPWFADHYFAGKTILPGVETLLILAGAAKEFDQQCNVTKMVDVRFDKILQIDPNETTLEMIVEIVTDNPGAITTKLLTKSRNNAFSRIMEHGRVTFSILQATASEAQTERVPIDLAGPIVKVPSAKIYQELVPFGQYYQNIVDDLHLSKHGAWARLTAPNLPVSGDDELSWSPFPLDAAFHAACVWGQRFVGFIPFPVGFASRIVNRFTKPGRTYETRVLPTEVQPNEIMFDLWIVDSGGELCETVRGIRMRDVTGATIKPPTWIMTDECLNDVMPDQSQ